MVQIQITLKSFEYFYIQKNNRFLHTIIKLIKKNTNKSNFSLHNINITKKQKLFTVNRSVFVHKKSREHFYFTYYTQKLLINNFTLKQTIVFLFLLKNSILYATQIEIKLLVKTFYSK